MTVPNENNRNSYTATASQTLFSYGFYILDESHIAVYQNDTLLTLTTHYTVQNVGTDTGGTITLVTGATAGDSIVLLRSTPLTQETDYVENDAFPAQTHEDALDQLTMAVQELDERMDRALLLTTSSSSTGITMPDPVAGSYILWKSDLTGFENAANAGTTGAVFNEAGDAVDFRVETDTLTHAIFADGSADTVTIVGTVFSATGVVDGRTIATDGAKLDGIEALADVTDAANVNAAGAVMESDFATVSVQTKNSAGTMVNRQFGVNQILGRDSGSELTNLSSSSVVLAALAAPGADLIFNEAGGAFDFRIEGDLSTHAVFVDASADRVGFSNASLAPTDGLVHIQSGTAGVVTANALADELVIEGSGSTGLSILSGNADQGSIAYGDGDANVRGGIAYAHNIDWLRLWAGGNGTLGGASAIQLDLAPTVVIVNSGGSTGDDVDFQHEGVSNTSLQFNDAGNNRVGFSSASLTPTDGLVHIQSGTAGVVTAATNGDELILENAGDAGMSILVPDANDASIYFGGPTLNRWAGISSNITSGTVIFSAANNNEFMRFVAGAAREVVFNDTGSNIHDFRVEGDLSTHLIFADAGADRVGFSNASLSPTDGLVHISSGTAGVVAASTNSDELVIEGPSTTGMSILCPDANNSRFAMGTPADNEGLVFQWVNTAKTFQILTEGTERFRCSASGASFNEGGDAANDFRVESDLNTHMFFVDSGNNSVHIDNSLLTGANDGDLVMANEKWLRWINNAGTTSIDLGIKGNTTDSLDFVVPGTGGTFNYWAGGTNAFNIVQENGGAGLLFATESSSDQSAPAVNRAVLYTKDNGSGKTQLIVRFNTGAVQVIATQP